MKTTCWAECHIKIDLSSRRGVSFEACLPTVHENFLKSVCNKVFVSLRLDGEVNKREHKGVSLGPEVSTATAKAVAAISQSSNTTARFIARCR